jgi:hypothetical protein
VHDHPRAALVNQHARQIRRGGAIVSGFTVNGVTADVTYQLRPRDVTVNGFTPGVEPPARNHDITELSRFSTDGATGGRASAALETNTAIGALPRQLTWVRSMDARGAPMLRCTADPAWLQL